MRTQFPGVNVGRSSNFPDVLPLSTRESGAAVKREKDTALLWVQHPGGSQQHAC